VGSKLPVVEAPPAATSESPRAPDYAPPEDRVEVDRVEPTTPERAVLAANMLGTLTGTVCDPSGTPLQDATVELGLRAMPLVKMLRLDTGPTYRARTGPEGKFELRNVPAGTDYTLAATHNDWAPVEIQGIAIAENTVQALPTPVLLKTGLTIKGNVRSKSGAPIAGATVELWSMMTANPYNKTPDSTPEKKATTSDVGAYEFRNLGQTTYSISARAERYATRTQFNVSPFNETGDTVTLDIELDDAVMLGGMVTDETGAPISGAYVRAVNIGNEYPSSGFVTADRSGSFVMSDLAPGFYQVTAEAPGFGEGKEPRVEAGTMDVVLRMPRRGSVEGRVFVEGTGQPVRSYVVRLRLHDRGQAPQPTRNEAQVSNAKGAFTLADVEPGEYTAFVTSNDYAPNESDPFTVARGEAVTDVEVRVREGGSITGVVAARGGGPVAGAVVKLLENTYEDNALTQMFAVFENYSLGFDRQATSGADGTFALRNLPPGTFQIRITHPHYTNYYQKDVFVRESEATSLETVVLTSGGGIRGTVFGTAGSPFAGQLVHVRPTQSGIPRQVRTGSDGRFEIRQLSAGEYVVSLFPEGTQNPFEAILKAQKTQRTVTVLEDQTVEVTIYDQDA
jgi:protocatechuate 3,4-dioxygenase beta subunit